jgi:cytochrome c553
MNAHRTLALCAALLAVGCANTPRSRDTGNPDVAGATLAAQVCSNCHGVTGTSRSPNFPNLAAQQAAYLTAQLEGFRIQKRTDPAGFEYMWGLSRHLSDRQIGELAAYYAAQAPLPQPREGDPARVAAGRQIFEHGLPDKAVPPCGSCHGSDAAGRATFPRLAGQHADYVIKQLTVFQRTNQRPAGAVMKTVAHSLSADDIHAVAEYVQSLAPQ